MGYTHGHSWTDDEIKETIMRVKAGLEIDRMPSRKEVIEYLGCNSCYI